MLQTRPLDISHTADNLADLLTACFSEWGITNKCIYGVTDNAKNILNAWSVLGKICIPCIAHTLNLAVGKVLKMGQVSNVLGRTRKLVAQFHYSTTLTASLKKKQQLLQVPLNKFLNECETRWNSCYDTICTVLEQQLAICAVLIEHPSKNYLSLETKDIKVPEDLRDLLRPLKELTILMSSQSYCTLSIVLPSLHKLTNKHLAMNDGDSNLVKECKATMLEDLKKRYSQGSSVGKVLVLASFLDPRFRDLGFVTLDERHDAHDTVKNELLAILQSNPQTAQSGPIDPVVATVKQEPITADIDRVIKTEASASNEPSPAKRSKVDFDFNFDDVICCGVEMGEMILIEKAEKEFEKYVYEPVDIASLREKSFCPLKWWHSKSLYFPALANFAKKYLCIPATSTPSERVFSLAGNIVTKNRCQLLPQNVDRLVFLSSNKKYFV